MRADGAHDAWLRSSVIILSQSVHCFLSSRSCLADSATHSCQVSTTCSPLTSFSCLCFSFLLPLLSTLILSYLHCVPLQRLLFSFQHLSTSTCRELPTFAIFCLFLIALFLFRQPPIRLSASLRPRVGESDTSSE
ncbi:uncharacterized protein J3D65DRAFT_95149 [Phyllosticta citribraziliensis]|uniref:Uncharacterized protein n=1 Tax=Phyllosticta citribraziliensis TaxID=989973 RepID=A0ABR1LAA4_9PEZI